MDTKERYTHILDWFSNNQPVAESELHFSSPFELIIAVILSAQCTDKRVNMVVPALYSHYPTPEALSKASFEDVLNDIKSISFPNNKAKYLIGMANDLVTKFNSDVPSEIEQLQSLPGVGRKTANVVASIIYNKPVIAVDTHVFRVSRRLGLSSGDTVEKVEKELTINIPENLRAISHHWLILHGRYVCTARKPRCNECTLAQWCKSYPLG